MNVPLAVGYLDKPFKIFKADSGALRFTVIKSRSNPVLILFNKECPHDPIYQLMLGDNSRLKILSNNGNSINFTIPNFYNREKHEFWLTWYNNTVQLRRVNGHPLLQYVNENPSDKKQIIGFVKFITNSDDRPDAVLRWTIECMSPIFWPIIKPQKVSNGKLTWVPMTSGDLLPIDALIAGFENEPLYIARANHRGSSCIGKYMKSKKLAFIPWGHMEHSKDQFQILCGYDCMWVKCKNTKIPENAFIAGTSELANEPLYIGRAMIENHLVNGKKFDLSSRKTVFRLLVPKCWYKEGMKVGHKEFGLWWVAVYTTSIDLDFTIINEKNVKLSDRKRVMVKKIL